jgi:hypothetical protein
MKEAVEMTREQMEKHWAELEANAKELDEEDARIAEEAAKRAAAVRWRKNQVIPVIQGGREVRMTVEEYETGKTEPAGWEGQGIDTTMRHGQREIGGFWSLRPDGQIYYTKLLRDNDEILSDYNPFSDKWMKGG